jgi:hypothetical protein
MKPFRGQASDGSRDFGAVKIGIAPHRPPIPVTRADGSTLARPVLDSSGARQATNSEPGLPWARSLKGFMPHKKMSTKLL